MFDQMNVELANQHRKSIVQDAENYRKIVAAEKETADCATAFTELRDLRNLAGRIVTWLDVRFLKPVVGKIHPRISH